MMSNQVRLYRKLWFVTRQSSAHSESYKLGLLSIQDESSMLVAHALGASDDDVVLDCCAAPGGKTTHIAEGLTTGQVYALDLHEHKVKLIKDSAERLGLRNIKTQVADSRESII